MSCMERPLLLFGHQITPERLTVTIRYIRGTSMQLLRNITIRAALLWVLGAFCLLWGGVSAYTLLSLNQLTQSSNANSVLVENMNLVNQGTEQYFRMVTRLARAVDYRQSGNLTDADKET